MLLLTGAFTILGTQTSAAQNKDDLMYTTPEEEYTGPLNIQLGTRVDYQREYLGSESIKSNSGFKGKYLMLTINGNINDKFSYSYRQRLNELHHKNSFFDGTDVMNLKYKFNDKWDVTAGKMGMYFGSFEYERNPMYMYDYSEWTNHIGCYKFGINVGFNVTEKDRLIAQVTESPFINHNDLYGYHLAWYGQHGWFNTIYTANVLEYNPGKFIYYLCFGHRLEFGKVAMELDYMNRATENHTFFFKNCSFIGELQYAPTEHWNLFAKYSYTVNNTDDPADKCVYAGTELNQIGGGVEFFPLKNKDIRFHATYSHTFGDNTNPNGVLKDQRHYMSVGMQWNMDLVDLTKKIWNRAKK